MPSQVNRYYKYVNDYSQKEPDGSRSILGAASAIASIAGIGYGIYSDLRNQKRSDDVSDWQKLQDIFSNNFAVGQFNEGVRQYNQNYEMEKRAMDLTQSNFENSAQIRTADLAKAGLNPLNYGGSDGASVSFSGGNNVAGSVNGSSVGNNQVNNVGAALLMELAKMKFESRERAKDRKSAENIAQISADASKYGSDLNYTSSSESNDIARVKIVQDREVKDAQLQEQRFEYDTDNYVKMKLFELDKDHDRFKTFTQISNENYRNTFNQLQSNYRSLMSNYTTLLQSSATFALGVNRLRLDYQKFLHEKDHDKKELALKNTQIALDSAAKQMQAITGLAGDICKAFIYGQISKR